MYSDKILVVKKAGVAIYGRIIDNTGRLGRYEVYPTGSIYAEFTDAEEKFESLISRKEGVSSTNVKPHVTDRQTNKPHS